MDRKINWLLAGQVSSKLSLPQALLLTCPHLNFFNGDIVWENVTIDFTDLDVAALTDITLEYEIV